MRTEIINGKVEIINETREESIQTLTDMLEEYGEKPLTESELKDWGIVGGETNRQLYEWVRDYISELDSDRNAAQNEWRYDL